MTVSALILAGGASRRMGSPKALLELNGETFLDRLISLFAASCDSVTVVLGHEPERIRQGIRGNNQANFVVNPDWERGQVTSLQTGLRSIAASSQAVMFTPVDYPSIGPPTPEALVAAWSAASERPLFTIPRFQGRRGHPILFDCAIVDQFLSLSVEQRASDVVHRHVGRTAYVDVDDPGICLDVDNPAEYRELVQSLRRAV